ncbi:hypothetical protein [Sandaracinus amylolyticus]|uniref:Uncharacterized protein n=1 Tax=Sandaracinus amylolyticus TaxID=927083 RepID=A0A0F6YN97_9BACT|nr:hypothetical protein [Sandaracinus amylolyticus]AKF10207.1 hypothetical protein DB32_007356 [Sandaracinus amylolyticus]
MTPLPFVRAWETAVRTALVAKPQQAFTNPLLVHGPKRYGKHTAMIRLEGHGRVRWASAREVPALVKDRRVDADVLVLSGLEELPVDLLQTIDDWAIDISRGTADPVRLVLVSSVAPLEFSPSYLLAGVTPFAVPPVSSAEAHSLAAAVGAAISPADLSAVLTLAGGHPYLMVQVLSAVARGVPVLHALDPKRSDCPFDDWVRALCREIEGGTLEELFHLPRYGGAFRPDEWMRLRSWGLVDGSPGNPTLAVPLLSTLAR